jgi:hypothetical protein
MLLDQAGFCVGLRLHTADLKLLLLIDNVQRLRKAIGATGNERSLEFVALALRLLLPLQLHCV